MRIPFCWGPASRHRDVRILRHLHIGAIERFKKAEHTWSVRALRLELGDVVPHDGVVVCGLVRPSVAASWHRAVVRCLPRRPGSPSSAWSRPYGSRACPCRSRPRETGRCRRPSGIRRSCRCRRTMCSTEACRCVGLRKGCRSARRGKRAAVTKPAAKGARGAPSSAASRSRVRSARFLAGSVPCVCVAKATVWSVFFAPSWLRHGRRHDR